MIFPATTLFLEVCVQRELWPGGSWPLVGDENGGNVARVLALSAGSAVRHGAVRCRHDPDGADAAADSPPHCHGSEGLVRPEGFPAIPVGGYVVESGCGTPPDEGAHAEAFRRMTSGIRDAVVFGAGLEYGLAQAMAALLRRRIRTHLVMDATGAADQIAAQLVVAGFKRRGVDVVTVDVVTRLVAER